MSVLREILISASPFPTVDLDDPSVPKGGLTYSTPKFCQRVFPKGKCAQFYRSSGESKGHLHCPYGFSVWPISVGDDHLAVTSMIGTPRQDGEQEKLRAKDFPESKVATEAVVGWIAQMKGVLAKVEEDQAVEVSRRLEALHEIRRLNQIVKTNMERVCMRETKTGDPDDAPPDLVRAYRASSLMSVQLDALDLLANPTTATALRSRPWVLYRTVDKMVRIYRVLAENRAVRLRLGGGSVSQVSADERTIHVIPSVFIDNAIKYSSAGGVVDVHVADEIRDNVPVVTLQVKSEGPFATPAEEKALFVARGRGKAARGLAEGSGLGLTLARVVAEQHGGWIDAVQRPIDKGRSEWTFRFQIPILRV